MEKIIWLGNLAEFLIESNKHTYAGNKQPERLSDGSKVLEWGDGLWRIRDEYSGSLSAPGFTKVTYKDRVAWTQCYGGIGMNPLRFDDCDKTFDFLKECLNLAPEGFPLRGPSRHQDQSRGMEYRFHFDGGLELATWREEILDRRGWLFVQTGMASLVVSKNAARKPIYPWDF